MTNKAKAPKTVSVMWGCLVETCFLVEVLATALTGVLRLVLLAGDFLVVLGIDTL